MHFFKGASYKNWLIFYPVEKWLSRYTDTLILINQEDYDLCKRKFKKCKDIQYVPGVGINEEKFNFGYDEQPYFDDESFGYDLLESENYYKLDSGKIVSYNY